MNIAVIGAGNVGRTLGRRFADAGHRVTYGVQDPGAYSRTDLGGVVTSVGEAASSADAILLAVPYYAAIDAVTDCGDVSGKIMIDATNPLQMGQNGLTLSLGFDTSGAEAIAASAPAARFVKCFNQTGFGNMADPRGSMMFICGDDSEANEQVRQLAADIGFDATAIGDLRKARLLEPLAMLWIHLSATTDLKRDFAFKIERH